MMVGLPASGKTTWVNNRIEEQKEKRYNVIGTNTIMERMKVLTVEFLVYFWLHDGFKFTIKMSTELL